MINQDAKDEKTFQGIRFGSRFKRELTYFLFALPALIYVVGLSIIPAITVVYDSFIGKSGFTLQNYEVLPQYSLYSAIENTLIVSLGALLIQITIALAIAMVLVKPLKGKNIFSSIIIIPLGISTIVSAYVFSIIFQAVGGYANSALVGLGLKPVDWFATDLSSLGVVMFSDFWKNTPLVALILYGGLSSISPSLYEAAAVDGAGAFRRFIHITLPNLAPIISIALLVRGVSEFNIFALPLVIVGYHPPILNTLIFENYSSITTRNISYAAATILLAIIMVYSIIVVRLGGAKDQINPNAESKRSAKRLHLSWRERFGKRMKFKTGERKNQNTYSKRKMNLKPNQNSIFNKINAAFANTKVKTGLTYLAVIIIALIFLYPLWILIIYVFQPSYLTYGSVYPAQIPLGFTLRHLIDAFTKVDLVGPLIRSLEAAFLVGGIALLIGIPAGYGLSKLTARFSNKIIIFLFIINMMPGLVVAIPISSYFFEIQRFFSTYHLQIALDNSVFGVALAQELVVLPLTTFITLSAFRSLPRDLEFQARVDGASLGRTFTRILIPLSRVPILVAFLLAWMTSWDEFTYAVIIAPIVPTKSTFPVTLYDYVSRNLPQSATFALVATIPVIILAVILQKYLKGQYLSGGLVG
ncbi:ABC transporter permease subunit [Cuniculiplasma sp. SKW4]|uniref:ABC transporter permease n=1 Tax=Cuniculiplasma sp. SKW4 TaxID=3400171 RepID=UPI003FD26CB2